MKTHRRADSERPYCNIACHSYVTMPLGRTTTNDAEVTCGNCLRVMKTKWWNEFLERNRDRGIL